MLVTLEKYIFNKLINKTTEIITKHPRLFSIAAGFAITLAVGTAMGMAVDQPHHMAYAFGHGFGGWGGGFGCFGHAFNRLYQNG